MHIVRTLHAMGLLGIVKGNVKALLHTLDQNKLLDSQKFTHSRIQNKRKSVFIDS